MNIVLWTNPSGSNWGAVPVVITRPDTAQNEISWWANFTSSTYTSRVTRPPVAFDTPYYGLFNIAAGASISPTVKEVNIDLPYFATYVYNAAQTSLNYQLAIGDGMFESNGAGTNPPYAAGNICIYYDYTTPSNAYIGKRMDTIVTMKGDDYEVVDNDVIYKTKTE